MAYARHRTISIASGQTFSTYPITFILSQTSSCIHDDLTGGDEGEDTTAGRVIISKWSSIKLKPEPRLTDNGCRVHWRP